MTAGTSMPSRKYHDVTVVAGERFAAVWSALAK